MTKHKLQIHCTRQFCWNVKIEIVSCVTYRQRSTIQCITPSAPNQALGVEQPNVLKLCQGPHLHIQKKTPLCFHSPNSLSYTSFSGSSVFADQNLSFLYTSFPVLCFCSPNCLSATYLCPLPSRKMGCL